MRFCTRCTGILARVAYGTLLTSETRYYYAMLLCMIQCRVQEEGESEFAPWTRSALSV